MRIIIFTLTLLFMSCDSKENLFIENYDYNYIRLKAGLTESICINHYQDVEDCRREVFFPSKAEFKKHISFIGEGNNRYQIKSWIEYIDKNGERQRDDFEYKVFIKSKNDKAEFYDLKSFESYGVK